MPAKIDITNVRFGRLIAIEAIKRTTSKKRLWICQCDCGKTTEVNTHSLRNGDTRSCGCFFNDRVKTMNIKHGSTKQGKVTPEYIIWAGMKQRCINPNHISYKNYGARNIKVCEDWNNFSCFFKDIGERPSNKHSIERRDVNGDYSPSNCFWATRKEQSANRRNNHNITFDNRTHHIAEWARILGIKSCSLKERLSSHNWTFEQAMSTPKIHSGKRLINI